MAVDFQAGLRDVHAAVSAISDVDGAGGHLRYRGYDIADLAAHASYEEVVALLWDGELPSRRALQALTTHLSANRTPPPPAFDAMAAYPASAHPLEALRTAVSLLAMLDPDGRDPSPEATRRKSIRLVAQFPALVAAWAAIRSGRTPLRPEASRSHAGNFLYMLHGAEPDPDSVEAMDALLVLHAEHELNASTFAARLVAGTVSDLHSAIVAALGALKGPRHGGANEDVVAMLAEIEAPHRAAPYLHARLEARARMSKAERADPRNRIPGWGHPVYKVHDPRAARLRALAHRVAARGGVVTFAETAEAVYQIMAQETDLPVNVDFFSAVIYRALRIPIDLCTSIFAISRVAGWCAHIMEQFADNRLIRPRALYTGSAPRAFLPLELRE